MSWPIGLKRGEKRTHRDRYSRFDVETQGSSTRKLSTLGNPRGLLIQHWKGCLDWAWPLIGLFIIIIHSQICVLGQSWPCPYHQWSLPHEEGLTSGKAENGFSRQRITSSIYTQCQRALPEAEAVSFRRLGVHAVVSRHGGVVSEAWCWHDCHLDCYLHWQPFCSPTPHLQSEQYLWLWGWEEMHVTSHSDEAPVRLSQSACS